MKDFFYSWKTGGAALMAGLMGMALVFFPEYTDKIEKLSVALLAFITALGFFFAKDGDKTGTTKKPR